MHTPDNIPGMKRRAAPSRKATNVTLSEPLLAEARTLGISVSKAAEAGVARAVAEKRAELWVRENHEALQSSNTYVEQHGLPLAKYRPH
jgi:antitoxin CcdA